MTKILHSERLLESALRVLRIEAEAISELAPHLDQSFVRACKLMLECTGRVVVGGMGKSGHIARKIAATLASTGTPSFFVHPAEASHGDLGMITRDDVFIALSNSGRTEELLSIVPLIKREGARLIAMTGDPDSTLAALADVHLYAGASREACPLNLAPTASTTAALALGDALAVALLEARGFDTEDFARSHPGGTLGRRLLTRVADVMRTGEAVPRIAPEASFAQALIEITRKRMGMVAVVDAAERIVGIFTDGDLRRLFARLDGSTEPVLAVDFARLRINQLMTPSPARIRSDALAAEAVRVMEERKIGQLLVADDDRLVGAINFHDLLAARVV
jgi:arabinose-5-phosphate isomerase